MEILKRGDIHAKQYVGTCDDCGTKVRAEESEVKILTDRDSPNGAPYVHCPVCSNEWLWLSPVR